MARAPSSPAADDAAEGATAVSEEAPTQVARPATGDHDDDDAPTQLAHDSASSDDHDDDDDAPTQRAHDSASSDDHDDDDAPTQRAHDSASSDDHDDDDAPTQLAHDSASSDDHDDDDAPTQLAHDSASSDDHDDDDAPTQLAHDSASSQHNRFNTQAETVVHAKWENGATVDQSNSPTANTERRSKPASGVPTFYVAGFWRRTGGALIDAAVILPISLLLSWLAGLITGTHLPDARQWGVDFWLDLILASDPALMGGLGLCLAVASIYFLVFQGTTGRTLGMRALKTRIITVYGDPPSMPRAAARTAGYVLALATLGLGFIWVAFDAEKRGLHDWVAGTYVVKT